MRYGLDTRVFGLRFLSGIEILLHNIQTGFWACKASCPVKWVLSVLSPVISDTDVKLATHP
jgi:hypothetical protein